jgi:hypothetical protein
MTRTPVLCPNPDCREKVGESIDVDGLVMLRIGTLIFREAQGICLNCGRMFYFSVSSKVIARIVREAMAQEML